MAETRKTRTGWIGFAGIAFALLLAGFGIWLTQASDRVVGFDTHRNEHDLQIVADGLDSWPATAASMARSNFIPQRLEAADGADAMAGWQTQARFWHPQLGRFAIRYALTGGACPGDEKRRAWFEDGRLEVRGTHDTAAMEAADRRVVAIGDWRKWLGPALALPAGGTLCYALALPLDRLIGLDVAAPRVTNLLIADDAGKVTAQLGDDPLPVARLAQLRAVAAVSETIVSAMPGVGKTAAAPHGLDPTAPLRVDIGARDYVAYVRDVLIGGEAMHLVALVPAGRGLSRMPPPPSIVAVFSIPLLLLLALTAVIKLRLIGPGEAMGRLEIAALGVGLAGSVALVTAVIAFAADAQISRAAAGIRTADTATALRAQFRTEVGSLLGIEHGRDTRAVWRDPRRCIDEPLPLASARRPGVAGYPLLERTSRGLDGRILDGRIPSRESVFIVGRDGLQLRGTTISTCRENNGGRLDVSGRDYFNRALEGETQITPVADAGWRRLRIPGQLDAEPLVISPSYSVEQLRSQSDGIDKTLIAWPAVTSAAAMRARQPDGVVVSAAVLRSLLAPVLPPTEHFMVVDLGTPGLRVLFHSERQRAQFEQAARELHGPRLKEVLEQLRAVGAADEEPAAFTSDYDGTRQHFGVARLPYTNWAVFVWHSHDSADRIPAQVLFVSLMTFSAFAALFWGVPLVALVAMRRMHWGWLWPDTRRIAQYRRLASALLLIAVVAAAALLLWPQRAVPVALLCWLAGLAAGVQVLRRKFSTIGPLRSETARAYTSMLVAALAALVVLPMIAFHVDAARFGRRSIDNSALASFKAGLAARRSATASIANVYYSDLRAARPRSIPVTDRIGIAAGCWRPLPPRDAPVAWAQTLFNGLYHGPSTRAPGVTPEVAAAACTPGALRPGDRATFADPVLAWESGSLMRSVWVAIVVALGLAVVGASIMVILRRLFGLATPLEAVNYPPLALTDDFAALVLPPKVMIVRPPLGLRNQLFDHGHRVDLSDEKLALIAGPKIQRAWDLPRHYVLYNLELTLREPERRREALRYIEKLVELPQIRNGSATLVLLAELTPLERLLQAYEQEKLAAVTDAARDVEAIRRQREDIRWSKLLEDFQTYIFGSVDKLVRDPQRDKNGKALEDDVDITVVRELAGLPEHVIATLLPARTTIPASMTLRTTEEYDALYRGHVVKLARDLHATSPQAAIDFIGLMLIEHYQQLWSASSRGEQLVLHNLSLRRLPSMAAKDSLKSLIRRGLVTFDPVPRLLNSSFGAFIQHAERPQTLQRWRADAPRGGWRFAVWPLLIILPLGLLALGAAILDSGQPLVALLPLVVATGPALLQALGTFKKAAS